jgi:hypothetical protein
MGGRQAVRPRPLEPVSKVRILPAQPVSRQRAGRLAVSWVIDAAPFTEERRCSFLKSERLQDGHCDESPRWDAQPLARACRT